MLTIAPPLSNPAWPWRYFKRISGLQRVQVCLFLVAISVYNLAASFAFAATYYVSSSQGNDANSGTSQSAPWRTAGKVNSMSFQPGDQILFRRGDTWVADPLIVPSSGTAGNPITFGAYGSGNRPKFDGNNSTAFTNWVLGIVQIDSKNYVTIDGLEITNTRRDVFAVQVSTGTVNGLIVRNSEIHKNDAVEGYSGFSIFNANFGSPQPEGRINNVLIENNLIYDMAWNCLLVNGGVTNVTIQNNTIYNCVNHDGIDIKTVQNASTDRNRHFIIRNNTLYNNQNGIFVIDADDILIENNIIRNGMNSPTGIKTHKDPSGFNISTTLLRIQKNQIYNIPGQGLWMDGTTGAKIYNNTIYGSSDLALYTNNNTSLEYTNNLAYANASGDTVSYNPLFVNAASGDFRLCEGSGTPSSTCTGRSQAIDVGFYVGLPFQGNAPDLGALESGPSSPPSAPTGLTVIQ